MGEGSAAIQRGGGLPVVGGGGSLMTHCADSVSTRSIAFKYVKKCFEHNINFP